jgi:hypothetical protein
MPFRHVVMFKWGEHVTPEIVETIREGFDELPAVIPEIRGYVHGADVGVAEGNFDYVLVADFDNVNDWRTYREHPVHLVFIEERIKPNSKDRAAIQYQTPATRDPMDVASAQLQEYLSELEGFD